MDFELAEHLISTTKRKHEDDEEDGELGKLSDFALDIIDKLDSSDELKQIVRLALEKNDTFMNVRKSLATQRDESTKIRKFIALMNSQFNMVSIPDIISWMLDYDMQLILIILCLIASKNKKGKI